MSVNSIGYLTINGAILDKTDKTKQLEFNLSSISSGATRTLTIPNANTTIVGTDTIDNLFHKTITDSTNKVDANALKTTGISVNVSSADPPVKNSALIATSSTTAVWSTKHIPKIFFNYLGALSEPAVGDINHYYGCVNTSTGTVVFNVTDDGTVTGIPIFTDLSKTFMSVSCQANQTNTSRMPVASIKSVSGNQVTVNVLRGNNVIIAIGLSYQPLIANDVNCDVHLFIVGV